MKRLAIGVDIGGSGIKAALVDTRAGKLVSERRRVKTPASKQPKEVLAALVELVESFDAPGAPVGVGFPAVILKGAPLTGFTAHQIKTWIGYPVEQRLQRQLGRPVVVLNDADAAGAAEMKFGRGRGQAGVVLILTLGTGIGSALFVDGRLVPNTEFGTLFLRSRARVAEWYASAEAKERAKLSWVAWAKRLDEYLRHVEHLVTARLIILGGGVSRRAAKFVPRLHTRARVVPAALRNQAGIVGAALAAVERPKPR